MKDIIEKFNHYLTQHGLHFEAVVIGGAALISMGIIQRTTKDVDCLAPEIPPEIRHAATNFARENPELGLIDTWLNNGPMDLANDLPDGWRDRLVPLYTRRAILLHTLGRSDLLCTKLFALCDRQEDLPDCVALAPTERELADCLPWLIQRDGNPYWPEHVRNSLIALGERIGYAYDPTA